ncbi:MAG: type II CRISPR-associated endonuclease Cas1 [Spirochaetota bacterium]
MKRTLYFGNPYHLSVRRKQFCFRAKDGTLEDSCPIEDLGILVLDHPALSMTVPLLLELAAANVAVVFCDKSHLPAAQLLSLNGHSLQQKYQSAQVEASQPLKKRLWQQTVVSKIMNQQILLRQLGKDSGPLKRYAATVKSGDSDNREAAAAQYYWPALWGQGFIRQTRSGMSAAKNAEVSGNALSADPFAESWGNVNFLLNYGYAVLRAAVARALIGSGLLISYGIHHHNQYNPYPLADDVMEPYRPFVDSMVMQLQQKHEKKEAKRHLLGLLACDVSIGRVRRPLLNALSITSASLQRCFSGESRKLEYPRFT